MALFCLLFFAGVEGMCRAAARPASKESRLWLALWGLLAADYIFKISALYYLSLIHIYLRATLKHKGVAHFQHGARAHLPPLGEVGVGVFRIKLLAQHGDLHPLHGTSRLSSPIMPRRRPGRKGRAVLCRAALSPVSPDPPPGAGRARRGTAAA